MWQRRILMNGICSAFRSSTIQLHKRGFASISSVMESDKFGDQILVEGRATSRISIINRPLASNSLTTQMVSRLMKLYEAWEENPDVGFVMMKGNGKTFCSGGDMVTVCKMLNEGRIEDCRAFFEALYKFVYLQGTYLKPHVAILDGITMGSGAGISLPAMFRLATNRTVFSHPEVQIGFHPDAGATFNLSRLPGYLGEYLALTGEQLNGAEMLACGLATHFSSNAKLAWVEENLGNLRTDDPNAIQASLSSFCDIVYPDMSSVLRRFEKLDECFSHDTVEEIKDALECEVASTQQDWCKKALRRIKEASPLSLKIALRLIRENRYESLDKCLALEYRVSMARIDNRASNDLLEGVRARLVDKDFTPKWKPRSLEEVSDDMVDYYFSSPGEHESELNLPTSTREPFL